MARKPRPLIVHSPGVLAVPLTRGMLALIDEEDRSIVEPYRWQALRSKNTMYAKRDTYPLRMCVYMHRAILGIIDSPLHVDHINRNGLDNRRCNIRTATVRQNLHNTRMNCRNTSGFRGVAYHSYGKWIARAGDTYLGYFPSREEAARAYDAFVRRMFGEFAVLNFPQ